jgi:hypothetical protein
MKRVLVFSALFPLLALMVFVAPEAIAHQALPSYVWDSIPFAYLGAIIPAWLTAAIDRALFKNSTPVRILGTAVAAALMADAVALFL